ncbi:MAG: hypothetical protein ABI184_08480, partial [Ginsengibacter sp.]
MLFATTPKKVNRETKQNQFPITKLGITFPFQPSMQDKRLIQSTLEYITKSVEIKLKENYNSAFQKSTLARLERIFNRLNYNTNKKSVAILIGPDEERITYLNFFTKPLIYFNKNISILDLVANMNNQAEFFLLFSRETKSMLFEYYNGKLHKEYETSDGGFISKGSGYQRLMEKPTRDDRDQQILNVLKLMNPKYSKPVFVTGTTECVDRLWNTAPFREIMFKKGSAFLNAPEEKLEFLASEINAEWRYWHYEFLAGKIALAEKSNHLFSKISAVSEGLRCSRDGLLLIDKYYKKQLLKS